MGERLAHPGRQGRDRVHHGVPVHLLCGPDRQGDQSRRTAVNRRGPLFAGIAAGVVALLTLVVLLLPKISAVHKRQSELTQARREAKDVQRKLAQLQTKIPPTADLPSLIRLLQGAADAAAVDFLSVSPGTPSPPV